MDYIITFLEGIVSFISPCMLPMLPVYISYFAGQSKDETGKRPKMIFKVIAFVVGFTVVFTALGLFSGTLGKLLSRYQTVVNIVSGIIVILFGLSYLGVFRRCFKGRDFTADIFAGTRDSVYIFRSSSRKVIGCVYLY